MFQGVSLFDLRMSQPLDVLTNVSIFQRNFYHLNNELSRPMNNAFILYINLF